MALNSGDTLLNGQYRILRLLGRGGFGFVYHAEDTHLGTQVAIKELIPGMVGDEEMLARFLAEAKATMRLSHDRIVRTHHVFPDRDNYYIVMEFMAGGSLEVRLMEQGSLPVDQAVRVAVDVCAGLGYAHGHGVVHCDLKPANILFDAEGAAKVADFGIAHISDEMLTRNWRTSAGFVAGTLPYMSPEQAAGVRDDPRVDIYGVDAVLYRMLTGRTYLDFDEQETPVAQADNVYRVWNAQPQPPSMHDGHIPPWLDGIVLKTLAKQPQHRYASAEALRTALLQQESDADRALPRAQLRPGAAAVMAPTLGRPGTGPEPPRTQQKRRAATTSFWPMALAGAALLVAVAIVVLLLFGGGDKTVPTPVPTVLVQVITEQPASTVKPSSTLAPTYTPGPTDTPTRTPTLTATPTSTPSFTPTSTPSFTPTSTPSFTPTSTTTSTATPSRTPTSTATSKPTKRPTKKPTPRKATRVPSSAQRYPAPVLIKPGPDGFYSDVTLDYGDRLHMQWRWNGTLQADEYFDVRFWREGEPHLGIAWTKKPELMFDACMTRQGHFFWTVAVIRGQGGQWLADLSPEAAAHGLSVEMSSETLSRCQ